VLAAVLSGCGADAGPAGSAASSTTTTAGSSTAPATDLLTVVAVGDSITAADSPDFAAGSFGQGSWVPHAEGPSVGGPSAGGPSAGGPSAGGPSAGGPDVDLIGGWAVPGATTADMRAGVRPLQADALVVMAGTNDVQRGVPWAESAAALDGIVATVGVDRVLLCSIVPLARDPAAAAEFNGRLAQLASVEGWEFADCGAAVRNPSGSWLPGMTDDGIHPTVAGAARLGAAVHEALVG
jgi:lysophospholipase L1-like esterase